MARFGDILSELRRDKNLTQKLLAEIIYVTPGTISNYENNTHFPHVEKLLALADYFDVSLDYLLGRTNSPLPLDVFSEKIFPETTVGEFIEIIKRLPADKRKAIQIVIKDMQTSAFLKQYSKKGEL